MKIHTPLLSTVLLLTALGLTSCTVPEVADPAAPSQSGHDGADSLARLVLASESGVTVRDSADGNELASFPLGTSPFLTPLGESDEIVVTDMTSGNSWVVHAGLEMVSHGDHEDLQVTEPSASPVVASGNTPTHVEYANGKVAIFYDGDGAAQVFTKQSLTSDAPEPFLTHTASVPHHGVAVPRFAGILMTVPGGETASGVASYSDEGVLASTFDTCPALHGAAILESEVVFGCGDGLLVVGDDGNSEKISYPGQDERRVGSFAHPAELDANLLLSRYGPSDSTAVLITKLSTAESQIVEVGAAYRAMVDLGEGVGAVLTVDGNLVMIDLAEGQVIQTVHVVAPWEIPSGHGGVTPQLAVTTESIYITDPSNEQVVEYSRSGEQELRVIEVGVIPTAIVAVAPEGDTHAHS